MRQEVFPAATYGFDVFIADPLYIDKGLEQKIVEQFIRKIIMPKKSAKIIVDSEIINERAIHVYEKLGFKKSNIVETYDGTSMVTAQLMEMDVV